MSQFDGIAFYMLRLKCTKDALFLELFKKILAAMLTIQTSRGNYCIPQENITGDIPAPMWNP